MTNKYYLLTYLLTYMPLVIMTNINYTLACKHTISSSKQTPTQY